MLIAKLHTEHKPCSYYLAWFNRCYHCGEGGWVFHATPNGKSIGEQDAHFWQCVESIARKLNEMIALERQSHA